MHRRAGGSPAFLSWNDQKRAGSVEGLCVGMQRRGLQQGHVQESQKPGSCQPACLGRAGPGSASASSRLLQRRGYKGGSREGAPAASQVLQKARGLRTPTPSSLSCLCLQGSLATTTNGRKKGDHRAQASSGASVRGGGETVRPQSQGSLGHSPTTSHIKAEGSKIAACLIVVVDIQR